MRRASARISTKNDSSEEHDDVEVKGGIKGRGRSPSSKHRYWSKFYNNSKETLHQIRAVQVPEEDVGNGIRFENGAETNTLPKIKPAITLTPQEVIQTTLSIVVNVAVLDLDPKKTTPTHNASFSFPHTLPSSTFSIDRRRKSSKIRREDSFAVGVLEALLNLLEQSFVASGLGDDDDDSGGITTGYSSFAVRDRIL